MFRLFVALFVVCALLAPTALMAEEVRGTVKAVDTAKNTITLTVTSPTGQAQDRTFDCAKDCKVSSTVTQGRLPRRQTTSLQTSTGLSTVGTGNSVTLVTERRGASELCTEVRMEGSSSGRARRIASLLPGR